MHSMKVKEKKRKEKAEHYKAPAITVIDIVTEQSILQSGSGDGYTPDIPGEIW